MSHSKQSIEEAEKVLITTSKLIIREINNNNNEEEEEEDGNKKNIKYKDNTQNSYKEEFHILSGILILNM